MSSESVRMGRARGSFGARFIHGLVNLILIAAMFLLVVMGMRRTVLSRADQTQLPIESPQTAAQSRLADNQGARLRAALEIYWLHTGRYPDKLDRVVQQGLLRPSDLYFPWFQETYYYEVTGERSYELLPPLR